MVNVEQAERKRILNFVRGSSVYPLGYTTEGNLALREQTSGEELYTSDVNFALGNPEKAFLEAEEELYPDKSLVRKIVGRWLERPMYNQERRILSWQAIRKFAQPKYLEDGRVNENYINLEEDNDTTKRILNSCGARTLEMFKNVQKYIQIRGNKKGDLVSEIGKKYFKELQKELAPYIDSIRVLQELENLRLMGRRRILLEAVKKMENSKLVKEAEEAEYSGY